MSTPEREQRLVFGEVAEQYDRARPSYPPELFDAIIRFGSLPVGAPALEVGAGTGKATMEVVARGLQVLALEPSAAMAAVLRGKGVEVVESTFEAADVAGPFRLIYAAQSWHWVAPERRYEKALDLLAPGGVLALIWNIPRQFTGSLSDAIDAVYTEHAPELRGGYHAFHDLYRLDRELRGFAAVQMRTFKWTFVQTTAEYIDNQGTQSGHLLLPEARRNALYGEIAGVIDSHGGEVEMIYDTLCFMARRG